MTYLQLLSGSGNLFLNQPEHKFRWLEPGWLQSVWAFTSRYSFTFLYPAGWIPKKPREHDVFLMEAFNKQNIPISYLKILNCCRLYLQVITMSDISTADGLTILPDIKRGIRLETRTSHLLWPIQGDLSQTDWQVWCQYLRRFEERGKLSQPMGKWVAPTHQLWQQITDCRLSISPGCDPVMGDNRAKQ
jgi:hypothetical protein